MELPEPAAELWARTNRAVREHLEQLTGSPWGMRLGGGSVLGAQWHHRLSFDIDITVDERTPLGLLDRAESRFRARLEKLGGNPHYEEEARKWTVDFGTSKLEIWAKNPLLDSGQRMVAIQGAEVTVLSNAQILRGKLERAELSLPRDAFDVCKAEERDPASIEWAVNSLPRRQALKRTGSWKLANTYIAAEAAEAVRGIGEQDRLELGTLGRRATDTAWNAVYERLSVRVDRQGVTVAAVRRDGQTRERLYSPEQAVEECRARGLDKRLDATTGQGIEIIEHAAELATGGTSRTVYEESSGVPTVWKSDLL